MTVVFASTVALDDVALDLAEGETVSLVGPSGSGKSTLLRVVAGLQDPDRGHVRLDGVDLDGVPPHRRQMGLMFQDHVLFGHRDVHDNVAFGPRVQGRPRVEIDRIVAEMLAVVGLPDLGPRDVSTLSGGEAQRVALARALAARPRLLMLDEPLGSLDRALRDRLVDELPRMLGEVGLSSLHITHDQNEAFAVADRVGVLMAGRLVRIGPPEEVWRRPGSEAVARFLGHTNFVDVGEAGEVPWGRLAVEKGRWLVPSDALVGSSGSAEAVAVRVEGVRFRGDRFEIASRTVVGDHPLTFHTSLRPGLDQVVEVEIDDARLARLD